MRFGCLEGNGCGIFCCVIEEEDVELYFGWSCFGLLLPFRAWNGCRTRVQKGLEGMVRDCKGLQSQIFFSLFCG